MNELGEFRMRWLGVLGATLAFLLLAGSASAQTAGKVEGTVTDEDTGQRFPAPGDDRGHRLGNISYDKRYYFVNNVPRDQDGDGELPRLPDRVAAEPHPGRVRRRRKLRLSTR